MIYKRTGAHFAQSSESYESHRHATGMWQGTERAVSPHSRREEDKTGKNEGATGSDSLLLQNVSYDNPSLEIRTLIRSEGQNAPDLTPYLVSPSKLKKIRKAT